MNALHGIRVLDLTHILSGPYAGMMLADLGAETIKIEPPGRGESTRELLADDPAHSIAGMGAYFLTLNRNKQSVTLNLKHPAGLDLFYQLVGQADVVLTNFSVGVNQRLRIDHAALEAVNPRIITCSITGFGETGPETDRPAFDIMVQGLGGNMSITGQADGPPQRSGMAIGDIGSGLMAVIGILSALVARMTTGRGQHVDISMLDTQISLMNYIVTMHNLSGILPERRGNAHFVHIPYNTYPTQTGYIIVAVLTDAFWRALMQVLPASDLDTDENATQPGRWKNRLTIEARLSDIFMTDTQAGWIARLSAGRVPCAPVNTIAQAVADPQVRARGMIVPVQHPDGTTVELPGNPVKLSAAGAETFTAPPLLGQHTDEVLRRLLGLSDDALLRLRADGVI
jgi:crotonobetainyl-CoA:carnitine CoA-transferase CaiB-like acyl-CoA transferase